MVVVGLLIAGSAWAHVPYLEDEDSTVTEPFRCRLASQSIAV